jgi:hypothetical protein
MNQKGKVDIVARNTNFPFLAISLILNTPHVVTIEIRNMKNRSIEDYPNKPIVSRSSQFIQVFAIT